MRPLEFSLRNELATLVLARTRGLLDEGPALFGLSVHHLIHPPLLHNRIGLVAYPGPEEELDNIFEPTGDFVDGVFGFAGTEESPSDHDFAKTAILSRAPPILVV